MWHDTRGGVENLFDQGEFPQVRRYDWGRPRCANTEAADPPSAAKPGRGPLGMMLDPSADTKPDEEHEWADCPLIAQTVRMEIRGKHYYTVRVKTLSHEVNVYVSPKGRSVRVYLDGDLLSEEPPEIDGRLRGDH